MPLKAAEATPSAPRGAHVKQQRPPPPCPFSMRCAPRPCRRPARPWGPLQAPPRCCPSLPPCPPCAPSSPRRTTRGPPRKPPVRPAARAARPPPPRIWCRAPHRGRLRRAHGGRAAGQTKRAAKRVQQVKRWRARRVSASPVAPWACRPRNGGLDRPRTHPQTRRAARGREVSARRRPAKVPPFSSVLLLLQTPSQRIGGVLPGRVATK